MSVAMALAAGVLFAAGTFSLIRASMASTTDSSWSVSRPSWKWTFRFSASRRMAAVVMALTEMLAERPELWRVDIAYAPLPGTNPYPDRFELRRLAGAAPPEHRSRRRNAGAAAASRRRRATSSCRRRARSSARCQSCGA